MEKEEKDVAHGWGDKGGDPGIGGGGVYVKRRVNHESREQNT